MAQKGTFKFGIVAQFKQDHQKVKDHIEEAFDDAKSSIQARIERAYGANWVQRDIFEGGGEIFKNKHQTQAGGGHPSHGAELIVDELIDFVEIRWQQVQENQEAYTTTVEPEAPPSRFQKYYKQPNAGEPAFHNGRSIEYPNEFGLMTGMMLDEIKNAYMKGGNEFYQLGNFMVSDARSFRIDAFPAMYRTFSDWYARKNLYEDSDNITSMFTEDIPVEEKQHIIGRKMKRFAETYIADVFVDELRAINISV